MTGSARRPTGARRGGAIAARRWARRAPRRAARDRAARPDRRDRARDCRRARPTQSSRDAAARDPPTTTGAERARGARRRSSAQLAASEAGLGRRGAPGGSVLVALAARASPSAQRLGRHARSLGVHAGRSGGKGLERARERSHGRVALLSVLLHALEEDRLEAARDVLAKARDRQRGAPPSRRGTPRGSTPLERASRRGARRG